jgi:hypothetical protein
MPNSWRGPSYDGEFPSLGWGVLKWAQKHFRVPDGPYAGEPLKLTDEQIGILVRFYALDDRGRFIFRRGAVDARRGGGSRRCSEWLRSLSCAARPGSRAGPTTANPSR